MSCSAEIPTQAFAKNCLRVGRYRRLARAAALSVAWLALFLVCIVPRLGEIKDRIWRGRPLSRVAKPKIRPMRFIKSVTVFDSAVQVDRFHSGSYVGDFLGGKLSIEPEDFQGY